MSRFDDDKVWDFENLDCSNLASGHSRRGTREVIQFEMNEGPDLCQLQEELSDQAYLLSGCDRFTIQDPKVGETFSLSSKFT